MFGDGTQRIQLCDAEDFCAAALAAVERRASGDWNVGAAEYGTVREDLQALIDHAGTAARLQPLPAGALRVLLRSLEVVRLSPFTAWHYRGASEPFYCDVAETVADLGWEPRKSNAAAVIDAYETYAAAVAAPGTSAHRRPLSRALGRVLRS
jgi:nucleoside-diphosphate-sugar epimerase